MQEETLVNCLTPRFRTIPVTLSNLSKLGFGITNYEYGDYNFYSFRTYGKVISNDDKATVPVFRLSCLLNENNTMDCIYTIAQAKEKCGILKSGDIVTIIGKLGISKNKGNRIVLTFLFIEENTPTHLEDLLALIKEETRFCRNFHEYINQYLEVEDPDKPKKFDDKSPKSIDSRSKSFTGYESIVSTPAISRATTMTPLNIPSSTPRSRHTEPFKGVKRQNHVLFETPSTYNKPPNVKKAKESSIEILDDSEPMKYYILTIIQSAKEMASWGGTAWKGITLSDIIT
uniref:CDC73_N domain-containing protein n=1 Tax=Strongyloides papillosus TaxID=174720 RepID=A0A0N5B2L8_STREA